MEELGVKKTWHFMFKVGVYFTVILGMIVQLLSPALTLAAENPTQAVTGALTIKNQDEQGSPLNGLSMRFAMNPIKLWQLAVSVKTGKQPSRTCRSETILPRKHSRSLVIQPLNRRKTSV